METAVNGKQWPLSCYGPFKDKPCLPNFIEDQSFEEMRHLCYTSKQRNYYAEFHREFQRKVLEASEKMKTMLTQQILDVATNIYDTPSQDAKPATTIFATATNTGVNNANQNVFGSNIFNTNNNTAAASAGNMFVGGNNTFAQQQPQQQQQQASIFGQTANTNQTNAFSFASANNNIFAQNDSQKAAASIFPQSAPQNAGSGMGIFAQAAQQTKAQGFNSMYPQQQQNVNPFGQNIFNQAQPQQQNTFTQAAQPASNIFAQANNSMFTNQSSETTATNLSQNAMQQQQPPQQMQNTESTAKSQDNVSFSSVYSRMEDLTSEEIEAFQSNMFLPGKVPCNPPPREFLQ